MPAQAKTATPQNPSRRAFLKGAVLGAAAAAALAAGKLLAGGGKRASLPGAGSIFEPRRQDLAHHWHEKLGRFRLR